MGYGFGGHIGLAKETTWGTAVAATDYVYGMSENVQASIDRFITKNIIATYASPDDSSGLTRVAGDIVATAHPVSVGHMLNAAMGVKSMSVVLSGFLFSNEFTVAGTDTATTNPLPAYTLEISRDVTSSQQYRGCCIGQLAFTLAPNAALQYTASWIGRTTVNIAKTTATFPGSPTEPFDFKTASLSIAGVAKPQIESFNITLNNNLEGFATLDATSSIARIKRTNLVEVTVNGTISFDDIGEYNQFINQTEQQFILNMTKANSFAIKFDLPRVVYTAFPLQIGGRDRLLVDFTGMARYHTGSAQIMKVTLTTTKSDY